MNQTGKTAFSDEDLSSKSWSNADLEDATFVGCTFSRVAFDRSNLASAKFTRCVFVDCTFASARLLEARFRDCEFGLSPAGAASVFKSTDLRDAQFDNCNLNMCRFEQSNLLGVTFRECVMKGADFRRSRFSHTIGRGTTFASGTFDHCKLDYADLSGQFLDEMDFTGSSLCQTNFSGSSLVGAILQQVVLAAADVGDADLSNADLRFSTVSEINILDLRAFRGLKVSADCQPALLEGMGLIVDETPPA